MSYHSKIKAEKKNTEEKYENKKLAMSGEGFGLKQGKSISLPKGNSPINK